MFLSTVCAPGPFSETKHPLKGLSSVAECYNFSTLAGNTVCIFLPIVANYVFSAPDFSESTTVYSLKQNIVLSVVIRKGTAAFSSLA